MPTHPYTNFDLWIAPNGENPLGATATNYKARAASPTAGQASGAWTLPLTATEQAALTTAHGSTRPQRDLKAASAAPIVTALTAKTFGERLFHAIFQGDLRTCLLNSLLVAQNSQTGLRIRLRLNDVPDLALLPWEYLYGPAPYNFFALSVQTPVVRYLELLQGEQPLQTAKPLRILAVLSDPKDVAKLDVESEWAKLQSTLADLQARGLIELERLPMPTLAGLQQRLRQTHRPVHILHFIGHGDFDEASQTGGLLWETENRSQHFVSADQLAT
ncbi:MAG: CHAT domain-containing protein, partial [Chloroflexota bacterium]|nr:CHAT domain-containing protein [Chloroflexota bacterium]